MLSVSGLHMDINAGDHHIQWFKRMDRQKLDVFHRLHYSNHGNMDVYRVQNAKVKEANDHFMNNLKPIGRCLC